MFRFVLLLAIGRAHVVTAEGSACSVAGEEACVVEDGEEAVASKVSLLQHRGPPPSRASELQRRTQTQAAAESVDQVPAALARVASTTSNLYTIANNATDARRQLVLGIKDALIGSSRSLSSEDSSDGKSSGGNSDATYCYLSGSQECSISDMVPNQYNSVFPGGETRCLLSTDTAYSFKVIPGASDKLMIYFQGGGSCWDRGSLMMRLCTFTVADDGYEGILDRYNYDNPFKDYTVVWVGYCSGDSHVGDVSQDWIGPGGASVEQRGFLNANSAVAWALSTFGSTQLDSFVVAGSSAGALAAQAWSYKLLSEFTYDAAAVISDSYVGVFPNGVQGPMLKQNNVCNTGLLPGNLASICNLGGLTVQETYLSTMRAYPNVVFATITAKTDIGQRAFYDAIDVSMLNAQSAIEPSDFLDKLGAIQESYSVAPNYVIFDTNANQHEYLIFPVMYATSVSGTSLTSWLSRLPVKSGSSISSVCLEQAGYDPFECTCWSYCPAGASTAVFYAS